MNIIEKHPRIAMGAGVAVAVVVVYSLASRGGGGSSGGAVYTGPSEALIAAQAQSAGNVVAQQAALNAKALELQVNRDQISAEQTVSLAQIAAADAAQSRESATQLFTIQQQADVAFGGQQKEIALGQLQATLGQAQLQTTTNLARIEAERSVQIATSEADAQKYVASAEAEAAKYAAKKQASAAKSNAIGNIIGGVLSIFSDVRVKTNIQYAHTDARGVKWYRYRYIGDSVYRYGVLAHEIDTRYVHTVNGVLAVNYEGLANAA
jgi:hypothetical protein